MPGVEEPGRGRAFKRLLSVPEAAERLGLPANAVYQFCRAKPEHPLFMPHIRLGKRVYIPPEALELWVQKNTVGLSEVSGEEAFWRQEGEALEE